MNAPMTDLKLPPHSIEAEQAVLGGLLLSPAAWDRVVDVLTDSDFYRDDHRRIFRHIHSLNQCGGHVDVVTVWDSIESANEGDQCGGLAYLADIANNTPGAANIRKYAEIVAGKALRRRLIGASDQIASLAFGAEADHAALITRSQEILGRLESNPKGEGLRGIGSILTGLMQEIHAAKDHPEHAIIGINLGFPDLDRKIGGLRPGDYMVIAGRPSMGKTTLALNIAENNAIEGKSVAVFSLEMGAAQLASRTLSRLGKIPLEALRDSRLMKPAHWQSLTSTSRRIEGMPLVVDESGALAVAQIAARCRRHQRQHGRLDLVVIDYVGLIKPQSSKTANSRADEVSQVSAALKEMAKALQCPIIVLSQLSRKVEDRNDKRPMMSDLRESGAIEQDADIVLLMYREEYYRQDSPNKGIAEAIIAKHRNGKTGTALLAFQGDFCQFGSLAKDQEYRPEKGRAKKGFSDEVGVDF